MGEPTKGVDLKSKIMGLIDRFWGQRGNWVDWDRGILEKRMDKESSEDKYDQSLVMLV